jgi:hypothetical protein
LRGGSLKRDRRAWGSDRVGRFYRKDAILALPVHLQDDGQAFLVERTRQEGASLGDVVKRLLREDIARLKTAG